MPARGPRALEGEGLTVVELVMAEEAEVEEVAEEAEEEADNDAWFAPPPTAGRDEATARARMEAEEEADTVAGSWRAAAARAAEAAGDHLSCPRTPPLCPAASSDSDTL